MAGSRVSIVLEARGRYNGGRLTWLWGLSQQAKTDVAVACMFFLYKLMCVVRKPVVPYRDHAGKSILSYPTDDIYSNYHEDHKTKYPTRPRSKFRFGRFFFDYPTHTFISLKSTKHSRGPRSHTFSVPVIFSWTNQSQIIRVGWTQRLTFSCLITSRNVNPWQWSIF